MMDFSKHVIMAEAEDLKLLEDSDLMNFVKFCHYKYKHTGILCQGAFNNSLLLKQPPNITASHVKFINAITSGFHTRHKGMSFLLFMLLQCPENILKEEGRKWFNLSVKAYSPKKKNSTRRLVATILTIILKRSKDIHEFHSKIAKIQPTFIEGLLQIWKKWTEAEFECICEYLTQFPNQALYHKDKIKTVISKFLMLPISNEYNYGHAAKAGAVYALFPLIGWGKETSMNKSKAVGLQLTNLMALSHVVMDTLLEGVVENKKYDHPQKYPFKIPRQILKKKVINITKLASVLINTFSFISQLIEKCACDMISLCPKDLLECVCRILQINLISVVAIPGQEFQILAFILPSVQQHAIILLDVLLEKIGDCLEPFFEILQCQLISLITSCKENSSNKTSFGHQGQQTKVLAYNVLTTLLEISRGCYPVTNLLIENLISDILPEGNSLSWKKSLSGSNDNADEMKKTKKGYTVEESPLTTSEDSSAISNLEEKMEAALRVVQAIFLYSHHSIPLNSLKMLSSSLLDQIHLPSCIITRESTCYRFDSVRKHFYDAILAYSMFPHPGCPPSYSVITNALSLGVQDSCKEISKLCLNGLGRLLFITSNPQVCSLSDAVNQREEISLMAKENTTTYPSINDTDNDSTSSDDDKDDDDDHDHTTKDLSMEKDDAAYQSLFESVKEFLCEETEISVNAYEDSEKDFKESGASLPDLASQIMVSNPNLSTNIINGSHNEEEEMSVKDSYDNKTKVTSKKRKLASKRESKNKLKTKKRRRKQIEEQPQSPLPEIEVTSSSLNFDHEKKPPGENLSQDEELDLATIMNSFVDSDPDSE